MAMRVGISALAPMLLGMGAVLMAMTANVGSPAWIKPKPRAALPQDPVPVLDAQRLAALTGVTARHDRAAPPAAEGPTSLRLRARGTLLGQFVDWAAIEDLETGRMDSYSVGDQVQGARVLAISRSLITLQEGNRTTYLEVSGLGRVVATPPPPPREVTPGRFSLSRTEVERQLANLPDVAAGQRLVPSGHGFKIFAIRPGSLGEQLGAKNGDTITKVNGIALDNLDALMDLLNRVHTLNHFEVQLERNGAPVTQTYDVN